MTSEKKTVPKEQAAPPPFTPLSAQGPRARQRQQLIEKIVAEDAPLLKRLGR